MRCGCENTHCPMPHARGAEWTTCRNEVTGEYVVQYIGAVCKGCYDGYPSKYRKPVQARSNPLNVDKSYPRWQDLQSDLTRWYENCLAERSSHRFHGQRRKSYCAAVAWKIARNSGKYNGYFTRMQKRASESLELSANDFPTFGGAIESAKKLGATLIAGTADKYTIFTPQKARGGYITRTLFHKHNNWHVGTDTRFVMQLPADVQPISQAVAAENPLSNNMKIGLAIGGVVLVAAIVGYARRSSAATSAATQYPEKYQVIMTASQPQPLPTLQGAALVQATQAAMDAMLGAGVYKVVSVQAGATTGSIILDGPVGQAAILQTAFSNNVAQNMGSDGSVQVTDLGPA